MAQIDVSLEGLSRLVARLTKEYGETAAANFALDEQLNLAGMQLQSLLETLATKDEALIGLHEQVREMGAELDKLRLKNDPENAHRYARATRKPRPKKIS